MNLSSLIGQRLMIGIRGTSLDRETRVHLKKLSPGGIILFSRNIKNCRQVKRLIEQIKEIVFPPPLFAIDQEGGLVVRFFREVTVMPGNMALGAADSPELAFRQGVLTAREIKAIGFDLNLAPVVDVATNPDNPGITLRSFGYDPKKVTQLAINLIKGMQANGIGSVAKHFPGKGAAGKDAHFDLPIVPALKKELDNIHLFPFKEAINNGVKGIMSSHVIYPSFFRGEKIPATFSRTLITDYLRGKLGFKGVIFSDDLEMGAITKFFPFAEAVVKAILAGHDMILICSDYEKQRLAYQTLLKAFPDNILESDLALSLQRIQELRDFCSHFSDPPAPLIRVKSQARSLATKIAEQSITLISGETQLPIIKAKNPIYAIIPNLKMLESVEDKFEPDENNFIIREIKKYFPNIKADFINLDPLPHELSSVEEKAKIAPLILAFIFNAKFFPGQKQLIEKLKAYSAKTIFILLRNPFDLQYLNSRQTVLLTYGYRKVQLAAAIRVLAGKLPARGKLPIKV